MTPGSRTEKIASRDDTRSDTMHSEVGATALPDNCLGGLWNKLMDYRLIQRLSLADCKIDHLPVSFPQHLSNLCTLDLSDNNLRELPHSIRLLEKLEHLKLNGNGLSCLPDSFGDLKCLKDADLSANEIESLPETLGNWRSLENLNLSSNQLKNLPLPCAKWNRLVKLDISHNKLPSIPICISTGMKSLTVLDVSSNPSIAIHQAPSSIQLTKFLAVDNGNCPLFPHWLLSFKYQQLEHIALDRTCFSLFNFADTEPISIGTRQFSMAQSNLSENILSRITSGMSKLETLHVGNEESHRGGNIFSKIELQDKKFLKEINFKRTTLPCVPKSIRNFNNVVKIDVSWNHISWLPEGFVDLINLEILIIDNNGLICFPDNMEKLASLRELQACNNNLSSLPASMSCLKNLEIVDLYDNDFLELPEVIKELENLRGLDINVNFFQIQGLKIGNKCYENLRLVLRKHLCQQRRSNDAKVYGDYIDPSYDYEDPSSCSENEDCDVKSTCSPGSDCKSENWDESNDSMDEFEPNVNEPRIFKQVPMVPVYSEMNYYIPAKTHAVSVKKTVAKMMKKLDAVSRFEEGQFDDP